MIGTIFIRRAQEGSVEVSVLVFPHIIIHESCTFTGYCSVVKTYRTRSRSCTNPLHTQSPVTHLTFSLHLLTSLSSKGPHISQWIFLLHWILLLLHVHSFSCILQLYLKFWCLVWVYAIVRFLFSNKAFKLNCGLYFFREMKWVTFFF